MSHVFISYAKIETRQLAFELDDLLNSIPGLSSWVDRSLLPGHNWAWQIQQEINRCDVMIVLLSPDVNRLPTDERDMSFVINEIHYALRKRKRILPVMAQLTDVPLEIVTLEYIDLTQNYQAGMTRLLAYLQKLNYSEGGQNATQQTQPKVPPPPPKPRFELPAPFAWVDIPAGQVRLIPDDYDKKNSYLKEERIVPVPAFKIAKYPVTNAQYALFVEAGGYENQAWWPDMGWEAKLKGWDWNSAKSQWEVTNQPWTEPRYWRDSKWNGATHPVVGVSWWEVLAYCTWLSEMLGQQVTLPTEAQWQRAGQGDDGRTYPWGNNWDCQRCNNRVKPCSSDRTTPVTHYEGRDKGDSPFGVVDMCGNVWEWTATTYQNGNNMDILDTNNSRVLRGGSWGNNNTDDFRLAFRDGHGPNHGSLSGGFRLALS